MKKEERKSNSKESITKEVNKKNNKQEKAKDENKEKEQDTTKKIIDEKSDKKMNKIKRILVIIALVVAFVIMYIVARGEYLEVKEIGENYVSVFWTNFKNLMLTGILNFLFIFSLVYITTKSIKNGLRTFFEKEKKPMPKLPHKSIAFILAIIVSIFTSNILLEQAMLCFNNTQFVILDPVFGYDIGYFIFIWPFLKLLTLYILIAVIASVVYAALYYVIVFNIFFDGIERETFKKSPIMDQVFIRVKIIIIIIAALMLLETQNVGVQKFLNLSGTSDTEVYYLYGAGLSEKTIKLVGYSALAVIMVFSVFKAIKEFKNGSLKKVIKAILIVPIYLLLLLVVDLSFNLIYVNSNELDKEKDSISDNIKYTKQAYGITIDEQKVSDSGTITEGEIASNQSTINNISVISSSTVLSDVNGSLTSKGYYTFSNAQAEVYTINGTEELVYVTPREMSNQGSSYNNKTYEYTHGFGVIISSATKTTETGNVYHIQKSFEETSEAIKITQPRIYFGLETKDIVVTNSNSKKEFDYPIDDASDNTEYVYDGEAGLEANIFDRVVLAIKEGNAKLLFSGNVKSDSKILTNRNIIERAKTIMPYLTYDENPYMVVTDSGELIWVLDAYTTSNNYPYSQRIKLEDSNEEINYIRNSVKVLINAYSGETTFYLTDKTDPIAIAYKNIYKDLFSDEEIPSDISKHFVYSNYLYNIQAEVIERYHNIQSDVLYREDDVWSVATHNTSIISTTKGTTMEPYYTMVKTSDEASEKLGLVIPYTQEGKQSLTAYLVGTTDDNGKNVLKLYSYNEDDNILGPMQLDTQLEQDESIYSEIESLNVTGTKITKDMIIVPINNTLLYVEPIYQQYVNEKDSLPILKKVVVASGNKVAIGDDLTSALKNLVSKSAVNIEVEDIDDINSIVDAVVKANNNLKTSTQSNDWEQIGKDTQKLQNLINKLETAKQKSDEQAKENNTINSNNNINTSVEEIVNTVGN